MQILVSILVRIVKVVLYLKILVHFVSTDHITFKQTSSLLPITVLIILKTCNYKEYFLVLILVTFLKFIFYYLKKLRLININQLVVG